VCAALALAPNAGCRGTIGGGSGGGPNEDAGPGDPCSEEQTALQEQVGGWLESTCSHAGCHGPVGARRPFLAAGNLASLVENRMFVAGDPEAGLMERIDPEDPHEIMPPTRVENPPEAVAMLERWIELGARADCIDQPPLPPASPNSYPQETLFTCTEPSAFAPDHALMTRDEFIHRAGGYLQDSALAGTPFSNEARPFSTGTLGGTLDSTILGLHLDVLDTSRSFRESDRNGDGSSRSGRRGANEPNRLWFQSLDEATRTRLACLTDEGRPTDEVLADTACKREYVTALLERHALQRRPTDGEVDQLVGFLDAELALETDAVHRLRTRDRVVEASMMMFGTLHRSLQGDEAGVLTADEWGAELAATLGTAPMNGAEVGTVTRPELGWVDEFRRLRDAGELNSVADAEAFIGSVLALDGGHVGGEFSASEETARPDVYYDERTQGRWRRPRRGRYWLAPQLARFFREYFDYAKAPTKAKDDPAATSRWAAPWMDNYQRGPVDGGYTLERDGANPNRPAHGEPPMVDQLDDFIARAVITAEREGRDVFRELLTSRTYRVPASLTATEGFQGRGVRASASCDPMVCQRPGGEGCCEDGSRCMMVGYDDEGAPLGGCMGLSFRGFHMMASVYDVNPIEESEAASLAVGDDAAIATDPAADERWVTMPEDQRSGVLTHPAWLTAHGGNEEDGPSVVLRGHWIREHLFCEDVAGLDLVNLEAQLAPAGEDDRARDRIIDTFGDLTLPIGERTSSSPLCANAACHGRMNELGLAFEIFNHAGFVREDDHGHAPDGSARIRYWPGSSSRVEVNDAVELTQLLAEDPHARRCFLRHVFRFFARRYETPADACVLADMETAFEGGSFLGALEALLTHESFLIRTEGDR